MRCPYVVAVGCFASSGGQIPDASLIHMARKRRQQARERGDDFIPIDNTTVAANQGKKSSRLIRFVDSNLLLYICGTCAVNPSYFFGYIILLVIVFICLAVYGGF